ncbi:MAG: hypothetical protein AAF587_41200 [Bacteroidota bacterium]
MSNSVLGNWFYEPNSESIEIRSGGSSDSAIITTEGGTFNANVLRQTPQEVISFDDGGTGQTGVLSLVDGNTIYWSNGTQWVRR